MIKVLIIEDDEQAYLTLQSHLERFSQAHHERFQVSWLKTAFEFTQSQQTADLIFFDVQLPGIDGLEAAEYLRTYDTETPIIFVTNLAQYAVEGYKFDAIDFMVKPVEYHDFSMRMAKAMRSIKRKNMRRIFINTKDGLVVMPVSRVIYIDTARHDLYYHLVNQEEPFVYRGSLTKVEKDLEDSPFVRISSNCLVNMDHVARVSGPELRLSNDEVVYISRAKRKDVLSAMAAYFGGNA